MLRIQKCDKCSGSMVNRNDEAGNYYLCLMCGLIKYIDIIDTSFGDDKRVDVSTQTRLAKVGNSNTSTRGN